MDAHSDPITPTSEDLSRIVGRIRRQSAFNKHVAVCVVCSGALQAMYSEARALLREVPRPWAPVG